VPKKRTKHAIPNDTSAQPWPGGEGQNMRKKQGKKRSKKKRIVKFWVETMGALGGGASKLFSCGLRSGNETGALPRRGRETRTARGDQTGNGFRIGKTQHKEIKVPRNKKEGRG